MCQYLEEDQEEICSSIEGELHQGGQSLDQLSVLLVEVLGTPRPSVLQIMGMVFRGLAVHAGNGDISQDTVTHSMHTYPQTNLSKLRMGTHIILKVITMIPTVMMLIPTIRKPINRSRKIFLNMRLLRGKVIRGFLT